MIWDMETGSLVRSLMEAKPSAVHSLVFSPDGRRLVSGFADGTVTVWDTDGGVVWNTRASAHSDWKVTSLAISPDGMQLAAGRQRGAVHVWELESGRSVHVLGESGGVAVRSMAFGLNDLNWVTTPSDGSVQFVSWNPVIGSKLRILGTLRQVPRSLVLSPDGMSVATGSIDGTLKLWVLDLAPEVIAADPELAALLAPKDQFEPSLEFEARLRKGRQRYSEAVALVLARDRATRSARIAASRRKVTYDSRAVALGVYDADRQRYDRR